MGFWDEIEKENARKQAEQYKNIDNPDKIALRSIAGGLMFFLLMFVVCPTMNKNAEQDYKEYEKICQNSFYQSSLHGIVKGKDFKNHTDYMTIYTLDSQFLKVIDCGCSRLRKIYQAFEIGDTILKPIDTLLVKIYNAPKYEELNRYETFRKK